MVSALHCCIPTAAAVLLRSAIRATGAHRAELFRRTERPADLRAGFKLARGIHLSEAARSLPWRRARPDPGQKRCRDHDWIRNVVNTVNHPASTCPMGSGPGAVLDPQLRVRGAERLRVVDASAMPDLVSAHINACVLMMAERASDLIRGSPCWRRSGRAPTRARARRR
jgi:choline dehydrogenase-like flavoprotein